MCKDCGGAGHINRHARGPAFPGRFFQLRLQGDLNVHMGIRTCAMDSVCAVSSARQGKRGSLCPPRSLALSSGHGITGLPLELDVQAPIQARKGLGSWREAEAPDCTETLPVTWSSSAGLVKIGRKHLPKTSA